MFNKRRTLQNAKDDKSRHELKEVEDQLAEVCAQNFFENIKEEIDNINVMMEVLILAINGN